MAWKDLKEGSLVLCINSDNFFKTEGLTKGNIYTLRNFDVLGSGEIVIKEIGLLYPTRLFIPVTKVTNRFYGRIYKGVNI